MRILRNIVSFFSIVILFAQGLSAQNSFDGFNYQIRIRDTSGILPVVAFPLSARISIVGNIVQPYFQETHSISSWNNGLVNLITGTGLSTGTALYSNLRNIPFNDSLRIKLELDLDGTGYILIEDNLIKSTPFALYSLKNLEQLSTSKLIDVDTGFTTNFILKYSSGKWISALDLMSDTATYSFSSLNSTYTDTAQFGYTSIHMNVDTVNFAYYNDTANFAYNSAYVPYADSGNHSTYTQTADTVLYAWYLKGNHTHPNFSLGTNDSTDLVFKTNNLRRMRISAAGNFYLGIDTSAASFCQKSINGFLFTAKPTVTPWAYTAIPTSSCFYFRADSAIFRGGTADAGQWNGVIATQNSFAFGRNNASGGYRSSIVFGDSCGIYKIPPPGAYTIAYTDGYASFATGYKCEASGRFSVAIGYECKANMFRNIAMGYQCITGKESANHAIGYRARAYGSTAGAFGNATVASGTKSFAWGNYASTNGHKGSFVYGDASTTDTVFNTLDNQFMIRAAGGILFYSDSTLSTGVEVIAGSGSWSIVSDSLKKANFIPAHKLNLPNSILDLKTYSWNYKSQDASIRHIGPTAQSFYRYFKLGESNDRISMVDIDGIILYYIQEEFKKQSVIDNKIDFNNKEIKAQLESASYEDMNKRADELLQKFKNK